MKKILFIVLLTIIGLSSKTMGQGTCANALQIYPQDSLQYFNLDGLNSICWLKFTASDTSIYLKLLRVDTVSVTNIYLYHSVNGCSSNTILSNNSNYINYNSLVIGNEYYLKIEYVGNCKLRFSTQNYFYLIAASKQSFVNGNAMMNYGGCNTGASAMFPCLMTIVCVNNPVYFTALTPTGMFGANDDYNANPTVYYQFKIYLNNSSTPMAIIPSTPVTLTGNTTNVWQSCEQSYTFTQAGTYHIDMIVYRNVIDASTGQFGASEITHYHMQDQYIIITDNNSDIFQNLNPEKCVGDIISLSHPYLNYTPNFGYYTDYSFKWDNNLIPDNINSIQCDCPGQHLLEVSGYQYQGFYPVFNWDPCFTPSKIYTIKVSSSPGIQSENTWCPNNPLNFNGLTCLDSKPSLLSNCTWHWDFGDGTYSNLRNPSHIYNSAGIFNVSFSITYHNSLTNCNVTESKNKSITIKSPELPSIIGNITNCDRLANYSISNPIINATYTWSVTNGAITSGQGTSSISILWSNINNINPAVITVTETQTNGCSVSNYIRVYDCCNSGSDEMIHDITIQNQNQLVFNNNNEIYINGTITFNCNVAINNKKMLFGPYAKLIIAPNNQLSIDNSSQLNAGCNFMWDGIYVTNPTSEIVVTGNSTIQDAINGLVSDNGGIITLNDAQMVNNFYSVRINNTIPYPVLPPPGQPYPAYPGSVKNTEFIGANPLQLLPLAGQKTFAGIDCNNALNFTIGDESNTSFRNHFSNMKFGVYAYNSDLNIYNNSFNSIYNGAFYPLFTQKYYPEGAIYATHKPIHDERPDNYLIVGGSTQEPLKRNYFENCNTGIYSFQYVNTLNNNNFKDCYNGINLVNISSGTEIKENMVYGSSASTVTPGKGISVRNAHPDVNGTDCLIEENHITNKQTGISVLGVKSAENFTRVTHNYINNFITGFPNQSPVLLNDRQTGISVSNCDGIEVSLNNINRNYPALGTNYEDQSILGIWTTESKGANIFQNYMTHMGSGIYTNGLLTNTQYNCNIFDDNFHGFQFDFNSTISNQGISHGGYNPYNKWLDFNPQPGHERMYDNGLSGPFYYFYDPNENQMYDPSFLNTLSSNIHLVSNIGAEYLCVNNGTIGPLGPVDPINNLEAREVALGQIVRDEKYYGFLEEEYKAKDREYVYAILREDPSIMNMGGADDNVYLQFYNNTYNSDIERVLQMREEMYEQNLELAREKLEQIADDNTINTNRKIVDNIYIDSWASGIYDFTQAQESALSAVANLPAYAGGDAVYTARVMLNIDPMDIGVDYAKPPQNKPQIAKENPVKVFPNPASSQLTIAFNDIISNDAVIEIYGNMGNLVLSETMHAGNYTKALDISKLNAGLYFYNISLNGTKVTSGKLTILNN